MSDKDSFVRPDGCRWRKMFTTLGAQAEAGLGEAGKGIFKVDSTFEEIQPQMDGMHADEESDFQNSLPPNPRIFQISVGH